MRKRYKVIIVISLIILIFRFFIYIDVKSKINYRGTRKLSNNLYVESFEPIAGGAGIFSGSVHSKYLTDSVNLNYFLGTVDDHGGYDFSFTNDSNYFISKRYEDIMITINAYRKEYLDSVIIDLKTHEVTNISP